SDAEMILCAYERLGRSFAARLLGDFAFVIWDAHARELVCGRDHFGVKQLYYHRRPRSFRIATEIQALFADPEIPIRPHRSSMELFLVEEYLETSDTLFDGVLAIPPGHVLHIGPEGHRLDAYYRPDPYRRIDLGEPADYVVRFRELLSEAVRCRMRSS